MKKTMMIVAVAVMALTAACTGKKTTENTAAQDTTSVVDSAATPALDIAVVAGTYEGTLPAADCPGIKTVLTLNTDSTYELKQDYIDRKDGHDEASGVFEVLDGNVLMLVRPSSGEHTFYKVKDAQSVIMTDSLGNEPESEMAPLYVLKKKN